jgi:NADH-quinone oxidoreductase subunit J
MEISVSGGDAESAGDRVIGGVNVINAKENVHRRDAETPRNTGELASLIACGGERIVMDVILFLVFAIIAVVCAINVVVQTHPISSAISLIGVMGSLAVLYLLLGAEFLAAAQVIVYAGAIMVLFVFVIMLLNAGAEVRKGRSLMVQFLGVPLLVGFLGLVAYFVQRLFPQETTVTFGGFRGGGAKEIGHALFTTYLLPFEVTSILILVAIIGAIVLARKEID